MCIFCRIINHELPSYTVYEDDTMIAILDIAQATYGHTLLMPKKHCVDILDADEETMIDIAKLLGPLSNKIMKATNASGCNILSNCKEVSGQMVDHLHFHIIPRYSKDDAITISFNEKNPPDLQEVLNTIKKYDN